MKNNKSLIIFSAVILLLLGIILWQKTSNKNLPLKNTSQIANPASTFCQEKGGQLKIEKSKLGEYGVCVFDDNRQCEEWAMQRGDCPIGGIKVTGFDSNAARYCAITGNEYQIKDKKQLCVLKNKKICKLEEFYKGMCN